MRLRKSNLSLLYFIFFFLFLLEGIKGIAQDKIKVLFTEEGMKIEKIDSSKTSHRQAVLYPSINSSAKNWKQNRSQRVTSSITLTATTVQPSCGYPNGSIVVTASGGTPPYRYTEDGYYVVNTGNFCYLPESPRIHGSCPCLPVCR